MSTVRGDTVSEYTSANGVTIDGVSIKDSKIATANSIDSDTYVDGSIDTVHIADDQITLAKMAGGTDGNVISYDASGDPVAIATGSDGQVLTSTGAGSPPAFEAAAGGAWTFIKSQTASSSASIDFVNGSSDVVFDSTYIAYQLVVCFLTPATNDAKIRLLFSTDAGSNYLTSGYASRLIFNYGSIAVESATAEAMYLDAPGDQTGEQCNVIVNFFKPSQTAGYSHITYQGSYVNHSAQSVCFSGNGVYASTGDIDAFRIIMSTGNIASGDFKLYGLATS